MKKIIFITTILIIAFISNTNAQRWKRVRYEVIYGFGVSNAMTELGGANQEGTHFLRDLEISKTRPVLHIGARYKIYEKFAVRMTMAFTWVAGDDALTQDPGRHNRNVSFTSPLFETSFQVEYSLIKERLGARYTFSNIRRFKFANVNTYLFAGIGGFLFNPKTKNKDVPVNRNEDFSKVSMSFPLGIGFKYGINRKLAFSVEIGPRLTLTDYLDGISDIHSKSNDSYMFLNVGFNYKLKTSRSGLPRF